MTGQPPWPALRRKLLAWFDRHHRPLPWRHSREPYRIWVSEVMLQQTTVAAVAPHFLRFMERFPTLTDLAQANEHDVLKAWEGLGYYRRARHLHQAAKMLHLQDGKNWPRDPSVWAELPGVGRYILGAVLSQAFEIRLPILEANSIRVLCRLAAIDKPPRASSVQKRLWSLAEEALPRRRVGDFNQAVMELGALVCKVEKPNCGDCPVRSECRAHQLGMVERIPLRMAPKRSTTVREIALIVSKESKVLLARRPDDSPRWAGMWEFPRMEVMPGESLAAAIRRLANQMNVRVGAATKLAIEKYTVTRFHVTVTAYLAHFQGGRFRSPVYDKSRWVGCSQLEEFAASSVQRRLTRRWIKLSC